MRYNPIFSIIFFTCCSFSAQVLATNLSINDTAITAIFVSSVETDNPGTTCIQVSGATPVSAACPGGFIAIKNNI